jgi:ligand-binding sensor domain-containing protein
VKELSPLAFSFGNGMMISLITLQKILPKILRRAGFLLAAMLASRAVADLPPDDFMVQVWDTDSGLPHSTVTSIAQTPDGYLWIGTLHGGLARFDGVRFVNFHPGNTPELKSIEIHKLLVDSAGTLWIGNVEGGLISYHSGKFRFEYWNNDTPRSWVDGILSEQPGKIEFSTRPGLIFQRLASTATNYWTAKMPPDANFSAMLCEAADGTVWYRTSKGTLARQRGTNVISLLPPGLRSPAVNVLTKDSRGQIWVGTEKEIAVWDEKNFTDMTPTNGEPDVAVQQLLPCADGSFWVQANGRLRKCFARNWQTEVRFTNNSAPDQPDEKILSQLHSFFVDSRGGLWFAHDQKGIGHVQPDGQISWVNDPQQVLNSAVQCWFEDHEGNVWLGLADGGLVRLRPRIFHAVWPAQGVDNKSARSVCEDENGVMWFGTGGKQVVRWAQGNFSVFKPPLARAFDEVKVLPAGGGNLWVGTVQAGLWELTNGVFRQPFSDQAIGTVVRCLHRDRAGALWIGSEFGLFRWDANGLKTFSMKDGFSPAYVLAITEDRDGDIWLGTALGELRRFHAGKFTAFRPKDSLTDENTLKAAVASDPMGDRSRGALSGGERFWSLYFDADNVLWIGTLGGGLLRFKDGQFVRFTARDELPSEHVSQILEDDLGHLWLGTRAGVVRVSKSELNAFANGRKTIPTFVAYGKFDGLPALECSGGSDPNCWRSRDGRLWFTTVKGAVWVDPSQLRPNQLPPPVRVEEVWVDGESLIEKGAAIAQPVNEVPQKIRIAAGRHYFEFKFCALSFTSPDKVKFKWRLAGLEKDWVDGGDRHSASYSFVPPGNYEFEVQACNNDGVWSRQGDALKLTVLPYFWQTWWFRLVVGLALAGVLMTIYSVRIARLRALEKLRLRIARDLHDEVGANLGSISLLAQLMEQTPSSADASQVRGIAVETIDTLRDIIWFIDPTHDRLSDLVARLQETARIMLPTVALKFQQTGDFNSADLSLAFRRNVPPLFKETLHNLLKHAHATAVSITVSRRENEFQFSVRDNGVGFDATQKSSGNGLKNLKRRAAEIGGRIEIESRVGDGTGVTLTAPITQTRDWW